MCSMGVFDALIDADSNFFINIIRLKKSVIPEFVEAYQHICLMNKNMIILSMVESKV